MKNDVDASPRVPLEWFIVVCGPYVNDNCDEGGETVEHIQFVSYLAVLQQRVHFTE